MSDNKYIKAIDQIKNGIRGIVSEMNLVDQKITEVSQKMATVTKSFTVKNPNGLKEYSDQITNLQKQIETLARQQNNLNTALYDQKRKQELALTKLFEQEQKKREAQVNRESALRERLNKQKEQEQKKREAQVNRESALRERLNKQNEQEQKQRETQINRESALRERLNRQNEQEQKQREAQVNRESALRERLNKQNEQEQKQREAQVNRESALRERLNKQKEQQRKIEEKNLRTQGLLGTAYERLATKTKIARDNLKNLTIELGKNHRETREAAKRYKELSGRLNEADNAGKGFTKGGLGGVLKGFKGLFGAFGIVGAAMIIRDFAVSLFETTKRLQSLNFALKTVTDTETEFFNAKTFLLDISARYGAELETTTERYTKFSIAAKQSGLGLKETQSIFESVTKASATLGLKTDELSGVYLALEQMLSKGKVTTEELRRQLGERLPGAFGIMADAIGVSVSELDKMLKKGEVLSADALPKFAKQLEKAYGIEKVDKIDTIVAAQNRLSTSWIKFVDNLETSEGRISRVITSVYNSISSLLDLFAEGVLSDKDKEKIYLSDLEIKSQEDFASHLTHQAKIRGKTLKEIVDSEKKNLQFRLGVQKVTVRNLKNDIAALEVKKQSIATDRAGQKQREKINQEISQAQKLLTFETRQYAVIQGKVNAIVDALKEKKKVEEVEDSESVDFKTGSIAFFQKQIQLLEEQKNKYATTTEEIKRYNDAIGEQEMLLRRLQDGEITKAEQIIFPSKATTASDDLNVIDSVELEVGLKTALQLSYYRFLKEQEEKRVKDAAENAEKLRAIYKTSFETFGDFFDFDLGSLDFVFDTLADKDKKLFSKENIAEWSGFAKEAISSVLDASLQRYDVELQEAQRNRDLIVNNELATAKEKRLAEQAFDEEERRIKTERAKKERQNTLIKIAIDTAAGIAAALAPPPIGYGPAAAPFAIPVIAGIGALQAALVASQPLPRFAEGTKAPLTKDTIAIVGDGGRSEAITEGGQIVGITPSVPTLVSLRKGQEVQKDAMEYINKAIYSMNMSSNGKELSSNVIDYNLLKELKGNTKEIKGVKNEIINLIKRPLNINNKVKIDLPKSYKI